MLFNGRLVMGTDMTQSMIPMKSPYGYNSDSGTWWKQCERTRWIL